MEKLDVQNQKPKISDVYKNLTLNELDFNCS